VRGDQRNTIKKNNIKEPPTGFEPATYALRNVCF